MPQLAPPRLCALLALSYAARCLCYMLYGSLCYMGLPLCLSFLLALLPCCTRLRGEVQGCRCAQPRLPDCRACARTLSVMSPRGQDYHSAPNCHDREQLMVHVFFYFVRPLPPSRPLPAAPHLALPHWPPSCANRVLRAHSPMPNASLTTAPAPNVCVERAERNRRRPARYARLTQESPRRYPPPSPCRSVS